MLKRELSRMASAAILAAAALACQEVDVQGADRFPRPEFRETAYEYPRNQHPAPRSAGLEAMDTVALLAALAAAALLARRLRSHRGLVALSIACLAWFGFGRQGCVCPVGSVQNVISGLVHSELVIPLSVLIFFAVPLGFALFFGRVFCAAVCPLGAVQELALVRPIAVPLWLDQPLRALPWLMLAAAALGAAIGIGFPICRADPFVTIFRLSGSAGAISAALVALLFSALVGRPYCRYLCPYGALLGLASRVACWPTAIAPDGCIRCRLCENACPYGAILMPDDAALRDAAERSRERRILACCLLAFPLFIAA
ncbi:MAG: 4Fe-4S binding protein, partial [Planctomycetota bacterium]|nr:4Fe-4S binding protein [Planctomycetota bacterium]